MSKLGKQSEASCSGDLSAAYSGSVARCHDHNGRKRLSRPSPSPGATSTEGAANCSGGLGSTMGSLASSLPADGIESELELSDSLRESSEVAAGA
eukprot:CAMPEP_0185156454 /NCGR_PEP_ID=MMETSP1139-20130426/1126_1 /TAXON_ID=298111 /ORGANISM="Pavlova sp., Strain CCMP459" /LENGTH=94 /DNA_ID=CAMNT_0027721451 /DNA_START=177 /DNA_END=462 /DNA_ORIENTATION=+